MSYLQVKIEQIPLGCKDFKMPEKPSLVLTEKKTKQFANLLFEQCKIYNLLEEENVGYKPKRKRIRKRKPTRVL